MLAFLPLAGQTGRGDRVAHAQDRNAEYALRPGSRERQGGRYDRLGQSRPRSSHRDGARTRSFDVVVPSGGSATMIVPRVGTIPFYCRYHPAMRGSLVAAR